MYVAKSDECNVFVPLSDLASMVSSIYQTRCEDPSHGMPRASSWMGDLGEDIIGHLRLTELTMLGSHDSATYNINPKSASTGEVSGALPSSVVSQWGKSQHLTIYKQLCAGCRYIDLRLMPRDDQMWSVHGLYGSPFREAAEDIVRFLDENPREVIVVDYQRILEPQAGSLLKDRQGLSVFLRDISQLADRYIPTSEDFSLSTATMSEVWSLPDSRRRIFALTPESMWLPNPKGYALLKDQHPDTVAFFCSPGAVLIPCREPLLDALWYNEGEVHLIRQRMPMAASGRVANWMKAMLSERFVRSGSQSADRECLELEVPRNGSIQMNGWAHVRLRTAHGSFLSVMDEGNGGDVVLKEQFVGSAATVFTIEACTSSAISPSVHMPDGAPLSGRRYVVRSPGGLLLSATGGLMGFRFVERESLTGAEHFEVHALIDSSSPTGDAGNAEEAIALKSVGYDGFVTCSEGGLVTVDRFCTPKEAFFTCLHVAKKPSLHFNHNPSYLGGVHMIGTAFGTWLCVGDTPVPSHRRCTLDAEMRSPYLTITVVSAVRPLCSPYPQDPTHFSVALRSSNGQYICVDDGGRVLSSAFANDLCVFDRIVCTDADGGSLISFRSVRNGRFLSALAAVSDLSSSPTLGPSECFSCVPSTHWFDTREPSRFQQLKCFVGSSERFLSIPANASDSFNVVPTTTEHGWDPLTIFEFEPTDSSSSQQDFWIRPHGTLLCLTIDGSGRFQIQSGSPQHGVFSMLASEVSGRFCVYHLVTGRRLFVSSSGEVSASKELFSVFELDSPKAYALNSNEESTAAATSKSQIVRDPTKLYITGAVLTPDTDTLKRNAKSILKGVFVTPTTLEGLEKYAARLAGPASAYFEAVSTPFSDERWELLSYALSGVSPSARHAAGCSYCSRIRCLYLELARAHQAHVCCCVRPSDVPITSWWWSTDKKGRRGSDCLWCRSNADRNVLQIDFVENDDRRFVSCIKSTILTGLVKACNKK